MKRRKLYSLLLAGSLILSSLSSSMGSINAEDLNDTTISQEDDTEDNTSVQILTEEDLKEMGIDLSTEISTDISTENVSDDKEADEDRTNDTSEDGTTEEFTTEITTDDSTTKDVTENNIDTSSEEISEEDSTEIIEKNMDETTSEEDNSEKVLSEEKTKTFTQSYGSVNSDIDFSSKQLLIGTETPSIFTWDTTIISEYNGVYLVEFDTVEETRNAYTYYQNIAQFVSSNITFNVTDVENSENNDDITTENSDNSNSEEETAKISLSISSNDVINVNDIEADLSNINQGNDAIAILNDLDTSKAAPEKTIALIDTGVNTDDELESISFIGEDTSDDNGHGTKMYQYIKEENPNAKVISIKALDKNGKCTADTLFAAIQYAIERKVDIINLSLAANSNEENNIVVKVIEDACSYGITVVGSAGNTGSNAKYFIPGCIDRAIIVGACNGKNIISTSNFGSTVDYYVIANSTSEAAARISGKFSIDSQDDIDLSDVFIFNYDDDILVPINSDNFTMMGASTITVDSSGKGLFTVSWEKHNAEGYCVDGWDASSGNYGDGTELISDKSQLAKALFWVYNGADIGHASKVTTDKTKSKEYLRWAWHYAYGNSATNIGQFTGNTVVANTITEKMYQDDIQAKTWPTTSLTIYKADSTTTVSASNILTSKDDLYGIKIITAKPSGTGNNPYKTWFWPQYYNDGDWVSANNTNIDLHMNTSTNATYGKQNYYFVSPQLRLQGWIGNDTTNDFFGKITIPADWGLYINSTFHTSGTYYIKAGTSFWLYAPKSAADSVKSFSIENRTEVISAWVALASGDNADSHKYQRIVYAFENDNSSVTLKANPVPPTPTNGGVRPKKSSGNSSFSPDMTGAKYKLWAGTNDTNMSKNTEIGTWTLGQNGTVSSTVGSVALRNGKDTMTYTYNNSSFTVWKTTGKYIAFTSEDGLKELPFHLYIREIAPDAGTAARLYYNYAHNDANYIDKIVSLDLTINGNYIDRDKDHINLVNSGKNPYINLPYLFTTFKKNGVSGYSMDGVQYQLKDGSKVIATFTLDKDGYTKNITLEDDYKKTYDIYNCVYDNSRAIKLLCNIDNTLTTSFKYYESSTGSTQYKLNSTGISANIFDADSLTWYGSDAEATSGEHKLNYFNINKNSAHYHSNSSGITFTTGSDEIWYPYYIAVKKTDDEGNLLRGVPIKISYTGGAGNYSGTVVKTGSSGDLDGIALFEIPYTEHFSSSSEVNLTEVWGQSGYTDDATLVYKENGQTKTKSVSYTDYKHDWSAYHQPVQSTRANAISSANLIPAENIKPHYFYLSLNKVSVGAGTDNMDGTQYALFWNYANASGWSETNDINKIVVFTLDKNGKVKSITNGDAGVHGYCAFHYRKDIYSNPDTVTHNGNLYLKISIYKDYSSGTLYTAQDGIDKCTGNGSSKLYIREVKTNEYHTLNPNIRSAILTENEYTLLEGDTDNTNNALTNIEKVYFSINMKKTGEGQPYSMAGIKYMLKHVKGDTTTNIAEFILNDDGTVKSIERKVTVDDTYGNVEIIDSSTSPKVKITFTDGRDAVDENNYGYYVFEETETNEFYKKNTNITKIDSSALKHGETITVTATANQVTDDEFKDALTDLAYTPYYLVIDKKLIDAEQKEFDVNGIPFDITLNYNGTSTTKTINAGTYYNFDNKTSAPIQKYDASGTAHADQTFTFTLTKDGKNIKDSKGNIVTYSTERENGRILVYLGAFAKNDDGSCPITVDVEENWTTEEVDKIDLTTGNITKITSDNYICNYFEDDIVPTEFNRSNTTAEATHFEIEDSKTLDVTNRESTTAITLVKTSGRNNESDTYKYTHNVTTKNGTTGCANKNYSLKGATYEIYNKDTNKLIGTVVCKEDGTTDVLDLSLDFMENNPTLANKTYYAKEVKPGLNYALNTTNFEVVVTKDNRINNPAVIKAYDEVKTDPISMSVNKVDADTYTNITPETDIQASYKISYYPADVSKHYTVAQLKELDITPETWERSLTKNTDTGAYELNLSIPNESMGYLIIEETKAPTGFNVTGSEYVMNLADNTSVKLDKNEIPIILLDRVDPTNNVANIAPYLWRNNQRYLLNEDNTESISIISADPIENPKFDSISVSNTTGTHVGRVNNETLSTDSIKETVIISNIPKGIEFTYKANLMDITDPNNAVVVQTSNSIARDNNRVTKVYESTGLEEQRFDIELGTFTPVAGHTYATVVYVYGKDEKGNTVERYTHNTDYSVATQTVYYPYISTAIKSNATNSQAGALIANETVVDTITYGNLPKDTKITLSGTLYDVSNNNAKINDTPVTKTITINQDVLGTDTRIESLTFTYDARELKGHNLTAVITASISNETVFVHNINMSDVSETLYYPDVNTELLTSTNTHLGSVQTNETAVETVNFKNIPAGVKVVAVGTLFDVTANKAIGSTVTSDEVESTGLAQQTITLPAFSYDASGLAGHILSAKVDIKVGNNIIATHNADYSDVKETIYYPTVATDLVSGNTNTQLGAKSTTETAKETITFSNVPANTTITLIGELWNKNTNEVITLANGATQVTTTIKSTKLGEQTAEITFTYDSTNLDDTVVAAKVFVKLGNYDITNHNDDLRDTREMVYYPKLSTELLSVYGSKNYKVGKVNTSADEKETAKETVTFKGIPKDVEVTYYAELRDVTNSNALITLSNTDAVNNVLVKTVKSTGLDEQSFNFVFEYNSMNLADHTLSAKVTAKIGDNLIGVHNEDLTDLKETIYYPNGHTSAADVDTTTKLVQKSETAKIYDDFIFSNLVKGINYTLTGTLHKRDKDGKDLGILYDSKNKPVEKTITISVKADGTVTADGAESVTFNSTSEETVSGTIRVLFTVDSSLLEGITTTAFETVKVDDYDIFVHANINDKDQQVHFMKLETDLVSDKTGTNVAAVVKEDVVKDKLSFEKIPYGATVVFNGTMMDKDTKSELVIDGNPVTGTVTLTVDANGNVTTSSEIAAEVAGTKDSKTNTVSGTIILTYKYDSTSLRNKTLVSFVTATHNDKTVYVHNSYDDKRETIYYPDIHTNANDINTKVNVATLGTTKVIDTVTLNNLVCGKTYQVVGTVHIKDAANNNPVLKINGKEVTKKATITIAEDGTVTLDNAENAQFTVGDGVINGTVDIVFDVDTSSILGKDMVAFEKLLTEPVELVAHEDINDKDQTVHVPDGGTTAMDAQTKDHVGTVLEEGNIDLPDTVHLENIAIGHTYHIDGIIMDKETSESLKIDDNEVTASADFTVDANGNITSKNAVENIDYVDGNDVISFDIILNFNFASMDLKGKDIVVFETGYFVNGNTKIKIFEEDDITNLDQTVHFPEVSTIATDDTYQNHVGIASETESITEKSILTNLVFGMTYEVQATVMDQTTGEAIKDKDGNDVTRTAVVTISDDGKTVTAVDKNDNSIEFVVTIDNVYDEDKCIDITVDIPITFDSTGTNGKSIVLFEDLSHNDIIVKSHHDINDIDEQIHYFELILLKKGLDDPTVVEFTLSQNDSNMTYSKLEDGSYIIDPNGTIKVLNPDKDGIVHIKGFNAESYLLTEIKTKTGKNLLTTPITIQFVSDDSDPDNIIQGLNVSIPDEDGNIKSALIVSTDPDKPYSIQLDVTNNEVVRLMTGGNGTYMFYILALIVLLAAGASVIIYRKRRKNQ